jgi:hypothetical protein
MEQVAKIEARAYVVARSSAVFVLRSAAARVWKGIPDEQKCGRDRSPYIRRDHKKEFGMR